MPTVSVDTLAKLLDMTPRRVQQLVKENILPKPAARGQYELVACVTGYIRHVNGQLNGDVGDLNSEKTRLTRAQAIKVERENALADGVLIRAADAVQAWTEMISAAKSQLLNLPGRLAPSLLNARTAKEAERILTEAVDEALAELADWKPADDPEPATSLAPSLEGVGAAEADHGQPVG
ncbi:hypothetical protein FNU76_18805 [Chitinimonas arctica]|uniref:Terminase small subunit, Nu1 n=1 Tax=Chitinimonas arctica TaxID=2594795 RepID=A0A516SJA0_9NEIS|nr:hypothetical protein [Chitinimonas arctica]QDQ28231.1 hypothetical protein FNU76_18805 [Chitinimonas arctica]